MPEWIWQWCPRCGSPHVGTGVEVHRHGGSPHVGTGSVLGKPGVRRFFCACCFYDWRIPA